MQRATSPGIFTDFSGKLLLTIASRNVAKRSRGGTSRLSRYSGCCRPRGRLKSLFYWRRRWRSFICEMSVRLAHSLISRPFISPNPGCFSCPRSCRSNGGVFVDPTKARWPIASIISPCIIMTRASYDATTPFASSSASLNVTFRKSCASRSVSLAEIAHTNEFLYAW